MKLLTVIDTVTGDSIRSSRSFVTIWSISYIFLINILIQEVMCSYWLYEVSHRDIFHQRKTCTVMIKARNPIDSLPNSKSDTLHAIQFSSVKPPNFLRFGIGCTAGNYGFYVSPSQARSHGGRSVQTTHPNLRKVHFSSPMFEGSAMKYFFLS